MFASACMSYCQELPKNLVKYLEVGELFLKKSGGLPFRNLAMPHVAFKAWGLGSHHPGRRGRLPTPQTATWLDWFVSVHWRQWSGGADVPWCALRLLFEAAGMDHCLSHETLSCFGLLREAELHPRERLLRMQEADVQRAAAEEEF